MLYKKFDSTYIVRVDIGEELISSLLDFCRREDIRLAQIDAIGASSRAVTGVFDLETKVYSREVLDGFAEITSLSGTVTAMNGEPYLHLHCTLADSQHRVRGGHLLELTVGATCEVIVRTIPGRVERVRDDSLGINLMGL